MNWSSTRAAGHFRLAVPAAPSSSARSCSASPTVIAPSIRSPPGASKQAAALEAGWGKHIVGAHRAIADTVGFARSTARTIRSSAPGPFRTKARRLVNVTVIHFDPLGTHRFKTGCSRQQNLEDGYWLLNERARRPATDSCRCVLRRHNCSTNLKPEFVQESIDKAWILFRF